MTALRRWPYKFQLALKRGNGLKWLAHAPTNRHIQMFPPGGTSGLSWACVNSPFGSTKRGGLGSAFALPLALPLGFGFNASSSRFLAVRLAFHSVLCSLASLDAAAFFY